MSCEKKIGGQNPPNCNWWSSPGKNHWLIYLYIFLYTYIYNMFFWCRKYQHSIYQLLGVNLMATQSLAGSEKELFSLISESKFQVEIWCSSLFFVPRSVWCLWWLEFVPTICLVFVDRHHLKIPPGEDFLQHNRKNLNHFFSSENSHGHAYFYFSCTYEILGP